MLPAVDAGLFRWETLTDIDDVIAGRAPGRTSPKQITLYESHGMGIQDREETFALSRGTTQTALT